MKVIVRSNDYDAPFWIGEYIEKDKEFNIPIVVNDQGERFLVMGIIVPYSKPVADMLNTLTPKEQWDTLKAIKRFWADDYPIKE